MTWRSFFCVVVAAIVYNLIINSATQFENGLLLSQGLVLGLGLGPESTTGFQYYEYLILAVLDRPYSCAEGQHCMESGLNPKNGNISTFQRYTTL